MISIDSSINNVDTGAFSSTCVIDVRGTARIATGESSQVPRRIFLLDVIVDGIYCNNTILLNVCDLKEFKLAIHRL